MTSPKPWPPRTEEQLQRAADDGLLVESHVLDLKRQLGKDNKKTAADLAAFSVDGGTIIIGVDETEPPTLSAVELKDLGERIEQIGLSTVDEPVHITTYDIESAADRTVGYLVVEVPVSGQAPHMVDGRYYERGDKTNIVLSDAAVLRWHERKIRQRSDLIEEARDALGSTPAQANIAVVANPLGAHDELLMELSTSTSWKSDVAQLLFLASQSAHQPISTLREPTQIERHPDGLFAATDLTSQDEAAWFNRAELVFAESGRLTLVSGGLVRNIPGSTPARGGISETCLIGHIELMVHLAGLLSAYGFNGSWQFAVATRGMGKTTSYTLSTDQNHDDQPAVYRSATYESVTTAPLKQIKDAPQTVVRALTAKLLRSLGSDGQWPWLFT
ncbi:hypothetical protein A5714_03365 [Mycobacterium sp. E2462]|uniref:AlbA family DNA-binding domain-containing protein n=1 Tax=Mycobacterium sp. E2462 TaxID=1834133 RepID=UPI0008019C78|nr:ATP-binding protein [Mycobacterium sp. E2462]OBI04194.1 hypothetical protein A5714_03365 [Mycobacterium sp. E2462]